MQVDIVKLATEVVAGSSLLHTILPPWEALSDFPGAQRYYKLLVYIVGYVALNGRSTLYASVSTKNGTQPSQATLTAGTANPNPVVPSNVDASQSQVAVPKADDSQPTKAND